MKKNGWLFLILFALSSCAKDQGSGFPLDGTYAGVYLQTGSVNRSANLRLVFAGNGFSGETTDTVKTICNGNYEMMPDSIDFTSLCSLPQDQLLLYGTYRMRTAGDSLFFFAAIPELRYRMQSNSV
jgi:hypothetical protein